MTKDDWISVDKELPIIGELVIFCGCNENGNYINTSFGYYTGLHDDKPTFLKMLNVIPDSPDIFMDATHWMRRPLTPYQLDNR